MNNRDRYCPRINLCLAANLVLVVLLWLCLGPHLLLPVLLQVLVVGLVLFVWRLGLQLLHPMVRPL